MVPSHAPQTQTSYRLNRSVRDPDLDIMQIRLIRSIGVIGENYGDQER